MVESEIIKYLKQNKSRGVAFGFMPQEVQDWCKAHQDEPIFLRCSLNRWANSETIACSLDSLYALSDDYEPKPQFKPHWEEFMINKDGMFFIIDDDDKIRHYHWWNWVEFLNHHRSNFNAFGGWYFDSAGMWKTNPHLLTSLGSIDGITDSTKDISEDRPAIPSKIAFWRYRK